MTATEPDPPTEQSLALLRQLVTALEADAPHQSRIEKWGRTWGTPAAIAASAITIVVTIVVTAVQLHNSSDQFDRTVRQSSEQFDRAARQNQYSDIVAGL